MNLGQHGAKWRSLIRSPTTTELLVGFCLLSFPTCTASAATTNDAALWRPRFATPAIVGLDSPSNRQFAAEIKAPHSAKNWIASLANFPRTAR